MYACIMDTSCTMNIRLQLTEQQRNLLWSRTLCPVLQTQRGAWPSTETHQHTTVNEIRTYLLQFNSHFPRETGLASSCSALFFPYLLQMIIFGDKYQRFLSVVCPSCHPTNSIIALMEHKAQTSGLASSFLQPPLDSWWKRHCSLFAGSPNSVPVSKSLQVSNTSTSKQNHCVEFNNCWSYYLYYHFMAVIQYNLS